MFTLEDKINIALAYIAVEDEEIRARVKAMATQAIKETDFGPEIEVETPKVNEPPKPIRDDISEVIDEVLMEIGVPCHLSGYDALACAIRLVFSDHHYIGDITKRLYPDVAKLLNTTGSRVERSIRHAVEVAFRKGDWKTLSNMFGNSIDMTKGKPTNQHMIAHCYRTVKDRLKKRGIEV